MAALQFVLVVILLGIASVKDIKTREIPNWISGAIALTALLNFDPLSTKFSPRVAARIVLLRIMALVSAALITSRVVLILRQAITQVQEQKNVGFTQAEQNEAPAMEMSM